jgi:hypothetical protein
MDSRGDFGNGPRVVVRPFGWRHRVAALAIVAAVLLPVLTGRDSFPLSTYPMYASRGTRDSTFATAVGIDSEGVMRRLSLNAVADTDDPLIAESAVGRAIRDGRAGELCALISGRVSHSFVRIEVVDERHDVVAKARRKDSLLDRRVHASCPVR